MLANVDRGALCLTLYSIGLVTSAVTSFNVYRVTTVLEQPYVMLKETAAAGSKPTSTADYEGFIPDLLAAIEARLGADFRYELHQEPTGTYGAMTAGRWNGMIGELIDGKADLAAGAITVSAERRQHVDFTRPFMTFDLAALVKKSTQHQLTSVRDLSHQTTVKYGIVRDGMTHAFFKNTTDPDFRRMFEVIRAAPADTGLLPGASRGIDLVRGSAGPYAFITKASTAEYWISREPCDLAAVPGQLERREYAMALPKGSALRGRLDEALTEVETSGKLAQLRRKWWADRSQCNGALRLQPAAAGLSLQLAAVATILVSVGVTI